MVSCLRSLSVTNSRKSWRGYPDGRGHAPAKYETFGFIPRCVDKAMESAYWHSAEQEARLHGCKVILLSSYSFQAPEFYQKHGYELAWQLNDFPPGHQYCYLVKRFPEANGD